MRYKKQKTFIFLLFIIFNSCAYYNTFFNAEEKYRLGVEKLENSKAKTLNQESINLFRSAIGKSWRLISFYGDSNSWADDALLLIGKSHYHLKEYQKSVETFDNFLNKFFQSPLKTEAELWLALALLELGEDEKAIQSLNTIISTSQEADLLSQAYFRLGEIYYESAEYDRAKDLYQQCVTVDGPPSLSGKAQYKLADTYYKLKNYEFAIEEYKKVLNYDLSIQIQYDAIIQLTNALLELNSFADAEENLRNLLLDLRFKNKFSLLEAKLANMVEFQGDTEFAIVKYNEVIEKYPKTEGSALSYFYLAQLYEFEFGLLDSAKVKYDKVKTEFNNSEAFKESDKRSKLLTQYLKIRNTIATDESALIRLALGDSLVADSVLVDDDPLNEGDEITKSSESTENENEETTDLIAAGEQQKSDSKSAEQTKAAPKPKKVEIVRDKEEIEKSLLRYTYNLAEYFLLSYEHYDSAEVVYKQFIANYSDSLLVPKAYYALYYIYKQIKSDSLKADSIKAIILSQFPNSNYGIKLSGKLVAIDNSQDKSKRDYISAENLLDGQRYQEAIQAFSKIAAEDSGSIWANKSRYAVCYIYDTILGDKASSLESYKLLAKEYPKSAAGKIALNKIKDPPPEIVPDDDIEEKKAVQVDDDQSEKIDEKKPLIEKNETKKNLDEDESKNPRLDLEKKKVNRKIEE